MIKRHVIHSIHAKEVTSLTDHPKIYLPRCVCRGRGAGYRAVRGKVEARQRVYGLPPEQLRSGGLVSALNFFFVLFECFEFVCSCMVVCVFVCG